MCSACLETRRWSYHPRRNQGCWQCMHQTSRSNRTWDLANGSNHGNNSFMHLKGTSYLTYHSFTRLLILLNVLEKDGKSWWSTPNKKDDLLTLKKEHWPQKTTREKCLETKQCLCDRINQMQHAIPAAREAQRVIAMTPLFWEKVVLGGDVIRTARMLFKPSASRPHVTQCWWIWPATKNWNHQKTVFLKCHLPDSSQKKKRLTYLHPNHGLWKTPKFSPSRLLEYDYQHRDLPMVSHSHRRWLGYHQRFPQRSLQSPRPTVRRQEDRNLRRRVIENGCFKHIKRCILFRSCKDVGRLK